MATGATPSGLSDRDVSYLKLLKTLKQAPTVTEGALGVVRRIAAWIDSVAVLNFVATHRPWFDDWEVKEALVHNDATPARYRIELEKAIAIFDLLREMDDPALSAQDKAEIQEDIKYLFKTLPEPDRPVVKHHAYQLSATRHGKPAAAPAAGVARVAEAAPPPVPALDTAAADAADAADAAAIAAAVAAMHEESLTGTASTTNGITGTIHLAEMEAFAQADAVAPAMELAETEVEEAAPPDTRSIGTMPVEQKVALAATSADKQIIGLLAFDPADAVVLALLDNPALDDRTAATLARRATTRVAEAVYRHRRIFMRPLVREALLECPNAPSSALLEVVNSISDFGQLLKLIRSPKVKFLEVKAKARARLAMMFRALGAGEKIAAIRRAGSGLLKELWTDFFRDEALVVRCIQEKQVDANIVMEIARSKIAPRRALEIIGNDATWTANYQIVLELVLNPKTPRQIVTKLIPRLNATDRKMVKNNPALPEAIRKFA